MKYESCWKWKQILSNPNLGGPCPSMRFLFILDKKCRIFVIALFFTPFSGLKSKIALAQKRLDRFQKYFWPGTLFPIGNYDRSLVKKLRPTWTAMVWSYRSTVDKMDYVCRIKVFPPKINVRYQLSSIYHNVLNIKGHLMLYFDKDSMATFSSNQNFPFWSPLKTWLYEVKLLRRKEAQVFTIIGIMVWSKKYVSI